MKNIRNFKAKNKTDESHREKKNRPNVDKETVTKYKRL